ncbi:PREDICTED: tetratricopeptide repeat protein 28-like [Branchiostoma belcheri]|uniref:Tetratricopeptide repeat protein 28-like n=1 Tax=Branchiostoma belcheri TaxID=7741 RepID=A0A6P4XPJ9_BRABE|nr:PREDICTED: tetratricopeptide repeat protein 28-like [Branchiostoma belcheri]
MAQLSRLAQLYSNISVNLTEDEVRDLRSLLAVDKILGKAKTEKATPLEIFNMLADDKTIGRGNLGFLVQVLRCLGKGELAEEAERLEQEHKIKETETTVVTPDVNGSEDEQVTTESRVDAATLTTRDSTSEDTESEETEVKEIISTEHSPGEIATDQQTTETCDDTDVRSETSELASLHIRELERLVWEPMKALGPIEPDTSAGVQDAKSRLETLLAELDTPAVMADQEQQCVLYCQIGDLYRAKLYNLELALQYYRSMLERSLVENSKQAKAHNRLGLTYDMLGKHEEATRSHERVLEICRDVVGDDVDLCVAYKNLGSSLILSSKLSDAKANYKTALQLARNTGNKMEEVYIHCKMGDLHRVQLNEAQVSHKHYTKMLTVALELRNMYWEMLAYNRLSLACEGMQDNELALEWAQKHLKMSQVSADKRDQILAHMNAGVLSVKVNQTASQLDTALEMAQEKGDEYGQMWVYMRMGDMQRDKCNSPRTAIHYYEQALALARQLGDRRCEGVAYNRMGLAHLERREYEAALEWYKKYLTISQEIEDKKEEVTALAAVGNSYRLLGKAEQATSHFDTALQLAQHTENLQGQMDVYCKMGDLQREQLHSPRTAIQYYEQVLSLARQLTKSIETASAYERLGLAHYEMGEYEKALAWHQKHLGMSQDTGDNRQQIRAHANLGCTYRLLGKLDLATSHHGTALRIAEQTGNQHEQMSIYLKAGDMHRELLHSPRTSIQYYERYLTLARQREEGWAYNRLGWAHFDMREYEAALEWHQKALKISQEIEDKKDEVTAHTAVGNAYRLLGKIEQATAHFDTALQLAQQTENQHGQMDVYCKMGDMQREQLHSPRTSIQYYEQYLALARQLGDRREEAQAYNRLGHAHYGMREYEAALEWYQKYLNLSQEIEDKKEEVTAHVNVGVAYRLLGKTEQATSHFDTALHLAQQTENLHGQMDVYCKMGDMQRVQLHSPHTAIQYYEQYLTLARQLGDRRKEGVAYNRLGTAHVDMRVYEAALEWYQKHLKISQEIEDKKEEVTAHTAVGNAYRVLGNIEQATSHFDTALQLAQQTENLHGQMDVYCKMGDMQREQLHSPRTAIQYYEQYLALARQLGDRREEGVADNRFGQSHYDIGEYEAALDWYQKHLKVSQDIEDKNKQITAHTAVGNTYRFLGRIEQATSHLDKALQLAQQTGDLHGQMGFYISMGDMHMEQRHSPRTAIQHYKQALGLARQLGDIHHQGVGYCGLGAAHYELREHQVALGWFQKYLEMSQGSGNRKEQITAHQNMAASCHAIGKLDQARSHYQSAMTIAMETGNKQEQQNITETLAGLQSCVV